MALASQRLVHWAQRGWGRRALPAAAACGLTQGLPPLTTRAASRGLCGTDVGGQGARRAAMRKELGFGVWHV